LGEVDNADAILLTGPDAFAAENALVGVIYKKRMAVIHGQCLRDAPVSLQLQLESLVRGNPLQLAVPVLGAIAAVKVMMRDKKLKGGTAESLRLGGGGMHHHAVFDKYAAGSHRRPSALNLNEAEAAAAEGQNGFPDGAETGDVDAVVECRPEESLPFAGSDLPAVDGQNNFFGYVSLRGETCVTLPAMPSEAIMAAAWHKPVHFTTTIPGMVITMTRNHSPAHFGGEGEGL
jgi:hypothetical protein